MKPASRSASGFTLIEVLVVVAVIALLIAFWLPTYHQPRPGLRIACLSNSKQLNLAWILYASDSGDKLATNRPYLNATNVPSDNWVAGVMDWTANPQTTNKALLVAGALGAYLKNPDIFHCPADKSESAAGLRARSYSMNGFLGNHTAQPAFPGWKQCLKFTELQAPTTIFVFVDEHANSIDDGFFINDPNQSGAWQDLPAANHDGGAGFGFADGHSEIHRWAHASTRQPVKPFGPKPAVKTGAGGSGADLAWILKGMTARETDSVAEPLR